MSDELNATQISHLTQTVEDGFDGTHKRLDAINGRVGTLEQRSAIIESQKLNSRIVQLEADRNKTAGVIGLLKWLVPGSVILQIVLFLLQHAEKVKP